MTMNLGRHHRSSSSTWQSSKGCLFRSVCLSLILSLKNASSFMPLGAPGFSWGVTQPSRHSKILLCAETKGQRSNNKSKGNSNLSNTLASSYVPSGLTPEEYQAIRDAEVAKQANKDYGRWGPRFASKGGPPPGNWFSMPQLWTTGAVTMANPSSFPPERRPSRIWKFGVDNLPGISLTTAMMISWALAAAWTVWEIPTSPAGRLTIWSLTGRFLESALGMGLVWIQRASPWRKSLPLALAILMTPLSRRYLNLVQQRWNWPKRRTWCATLVGFNSLLFFLRRLLL